MAEEIFERGDVADRYKWDTSPLVSSDEEWERRFAALPEEIKELSAYRGRLGDDKVLLEFLKKNDDLVNRASRLFLYAQMRNHVDLRVKKYQEMLGKAHAVIVSYMTAVSFVEPEICRRTRKNLLALSRKPEFKDYDYYLSRFADRKKHVLSEKEEALLAGCAGFTGNFMSGFNMFDSADVKFKPVETPDGPVEMSHGVYGVLLQNPDQRVREEAFTSMHRAYADHINTIAELYSGSVKKDRFFADARKYESTLDEALSSTDVCPAAYETLIRCVDGSLNLMHDYVAFRKEALGLETLNMWDLYVPLVKGAEISVPFEEAAEIVKSALAPLGREYAGLLDTAFKDGWIDVMENRGKKSGAYSTSVYGCHPYVLLNYRRTTHDVFTIAHELGHAMHSWYSMRNQPISKADYEIFVAEIASTVNEVLMVKHLLSSAEDADTRKFLLSYYLDMFRTTLFRQTMFAEFEWEAHKMAERDVPLTAEGLSDLYYSLNRKFYGEAVEHNELIRYEWARIPHFYRPYYVFQYATGITAAVTIAGDILKNGEKAFERYRRFLSAGGSASPVEILKPAGVDLTDEAPFAAAMNEFRDTLDELRTLYRS